jgi:DNA-binding transcriptional MerR regulator/DNA-binding CsgD family transcriptional regulator
MTIGELSRRTGVSPDLLRKWESRYGVVEPTRTPGSRRLYSPLDLARIQWMLRYLKRGVGAAQAAELVLAAASRPSARDTSTAGDAVPAGGGFAFQRSLIPMLLADDHRRALDVNQAGCLLLRLDRASVLRLRLDDLAGRAATVAMRRAWVAFHHLGTRGGSIAMDMPDGAQLELDWGAKANVEPGRHLLLCCLPWRTRTRAREDRHEVAALTPRERRVLGLLAMGERDSSIATTLGVSRATIETHVRRCLVKLGAEHPAHAIALGLHRGEIAVRLASPPA